MSKIYVNINLVRRGEDEKGYDHRAEFVAADQLTDLSRVGSKSPDAEIINGTTSLVPSYGHGRSRPLSLDLD